MDANGQLFSLKWNNYLSHIMDAFEHLRSEENLVDVTLSCEGYKIKAHKMLLSACSSYFKDLFKVHTMVLFYPLAKFSILFSYRPLSVL